MKFLLFISSSLLFLAAMANGEAVFQRDVQFDVDFGGLHAKDVIFNGPKEGSTSTDYQKFDVMLSTVHALTFVVDKDCMEEKDRDFCKTHPGGYDTKKPDSTRDGDTVEMGQGDLAGAGKAVIDDIQIVDGLKIVKQKFGVMWGKVEASDKFWNIKRDEADAAKPVTRANKALGCVSLQLGAHDAELRNYFGDKTTLQALVDGEEATGATRQMAQPIMTLRMDKTDKSAAPNAAGKLMFGALTVDDQCHSWNSIKPADEKQATWQVKLDEMEGVDAAKDAMAIVDTSSEKITFPKAILDALQSGPLKGKENECALDKLPTLKFTVGGLVYSVPPAHYVLPEQEAKCPHLLAANADDKDQQVHLGLPFLRSTCLALDMKTRAVWLSGGACKEGHAGKDKASSAPASATSFVSTFGSILMGLVVFAAPALMLI